MQLQRVALSQFRNYAELDLEPASGLNVFVGRNAQGKSNLLEAIAMLGTGKSFRTNRDGDLVREGLELTVVRGDASIRAGTVHLGCTVTRSPRVRKTYTVNGESVKYARFLGSIRVVTFVPADLQLVSGAPSQRRSFLNMALAQDDRTYYHELVRYQKALAQKNALLRAAAEPDPQLLEIYNHTLAQSGTYLILARNHWIAEIAREAAQASSTWTAAAERLDVAYAPNVPFEAPTADAVSFALTERLAAMAPAERARRSALAGPHRDDIALSLGGSALAAYGSQGQQRTAVLALKVAEYAVMRDRSNEAPLLLLDDVLSELDRERAAAFLTGIGEFEQAFITATHFPEGMPGAPRLCEIEGGVVRAC